jgi:hypothetical protein
MSHATAHKFTSIHLSIINYIYMRITPLFRIVLVNRHNTLYKMPENQTSEGMYICVRACQAMQEKEREEKGGITFLTAKREKERERERK